jgi:hypothetical protein
MREPFLSFYENAEKDNIPAKVKEEILRTDDPGNLQVFDNGMRRLNNGSYTEHGITNPKIDWMRKFFTQRWSAGDTPYPLLNGKGKVLISTAWGAAGAAQVGKVCAELDIPYLIYSGMLTESERDAIVKHYNEAPKDEMLCLILMSAGGVGLDLKETKYVIVLDVLWQPAGTEQVVARAVRYKSHESPHAVVHVYYLLLTKPKTATVATLPSIDDIMNSRITRKVQERARLMKALKIASIETDSNCPEV